MRGFRAKDADREKYVDLIEAAYVDGQLGEADRELRVGRALSAETLDELETLTRDLQRPAGFVPSAPAPQRSYVRVTRRTSADPGRWIALVIAGVVSLFILGVATTIIVSVATFNDTVDDFVFEPADPVGSAVPDEELIDAPQPTFTMRASDVRTMLRRYEARFGTTDAWDITFFPGRVAVDVPVRGSRPRFESWSWTGEWEQYGDARGVPPSYTGVVDLGEIGVDRLMANIRTAERTLGVQRGKFTHASLWRFDETGATLNIYVGNTFSESGYLRTTLAGDRIVARFPYDG